MKFKENYLTKGERSMKKLLSVVLAIILTMSLCLLGTSAVVESRSRTSGQPAKFSSRIGEEKILQVADITIPEYAADCYYSKSGKYESYAYMYNYFNGFTLTMEDGSVIESSSSSVSIDGQYYYLSVRDNQQAEPWELGGTYTVTAELIGAVTEFHVTIVENPKKPIAFKVEDMNVMYNSHVYTNVGGWRSNNNKYSYFPDYTVTFPDGTERKYNLYDVFYSYDNTDYELACSYIGNLSPKFNDNQNTEPWELGGTYTVTASMCGLEDTFQVTVADTNIESVEFSDICLIVNGDGSTKTVNGDTYFHYDYAPDFTVNYKDGSSITSKYSDSESWIIDDLLYKERQGTGGAWLGGAMPIYTDSQETEHWEPGNTYTVFANFMGFTGSFHVTIIENPIIAVADTEISENKIQYYLEDGLISDIALILDDGTSVTCRNLYINYALMFNLYGNTFYFNFSAPKVIYHMNDDGNLSATLNIFGKDYTHNLIIKNAGDLDGNGRIDSDDAIYLLNHTMMPDHYPIDQDCDFNGDGHVDGDDAIYLLYHTLLPDRYPLK